MLSSGLALPSQFPSPKITEQSSRKSFEDRKFFEARVSDRFARRQVKPEFLRSGKIMVLGVGRSSVLVKHVKTRQDFSDFLKKLFLLQIPRGAVKPQQTSNFGLV